MESSSSCCSLTSLKENCFQNKVVQSVPFKATMLVTGAGSAAVGSVCFASQLLPNFSPFRNLKPENALLISIIAAVVGTVFILIGITAICVGKRKIKEDKFNSMRSINYSETTALLFNSSTQYFSQQHFEVLNEKSIAWAAGKSQQRKEMATSFITHTFSVNEVKYILTGVFDGFGGNTVAQFLEKNMKSVFEKELSKINSFSQPVIQDAIKSACARVDKEIGNSDLSNSGACAAMALLVNEFLFAINVGNCRIVLSEDGKVRELSEDAIPTNKRFSKEASDRGFFINEGSGKLNGSMLVSRAFGAFANGLKDGKKVIPSDPDIRVYQLNRIQKGDFFILATNGIWNVISSQEAISLAKKQTPEKAAQKLCDEALKKSTKSNVTVGVFYL